MRRWDGLVEEYVAACRARGLAEGDLLGDFRTS